MKKHVKHLVTLIVLIGMSACEKDEIAPIESKPDLGSTDSEALKNFNNGMIKSYHNDVVLKWNEAISLAIDNKMPPPAEARIYAMVSLAMHDALNTIVPKYETTAVDNSGVDARGVSKKNITPLADAAISQAAFEVLTQLFPASQASADELLATILSGIKDADYRETGIAIGTAAASALLLKRQDDIPMGFSSYQMGTDPGVHQANYMPWAIANPPIWPNNAVYAANLGNLAPFGMASGHQFRAVPPYPINSREYTADFNEVKRLGCTACPDRTDEQTEIGTFWIENVSSSTNRIARFMIHQEKLDGWEAARLLALLHITQIDANISSFEGKYFYNYWRPITAIRAADTDGNENTTGDLGWTSISTTPPTPDYPSTHAYTGGAGSELLKLFFGRDKISIRVTSPYYLPGVERKLTSFTQIGRENALSRIYIGFHFRKAVEEGEKKGRLLGKYVFEHALRELRH